MRSPWATELDRLDWEQTEEDVREIERDLELPPDEPYHDREDDDQNDDEESDGVT
jgi:hypothetical protein